MSTEPDILELRDVRVVHRRGSEDVTLTDGMSFRIGKAEVFGMVGESGSGKSITSLAVLRLLGSETRTQGSIRFRQRELTTLDEQQMQQVRGAQISMIFQEPSSALNPVFTVGTQLVSAIRAHRPMRASEARRRAEELLREVGLPDPASRLDFYPHQLSGGQCQRVMIAMALSGGASLVIADEPTTALDVTIQVQIVHLLERLVRENGLSLLFISHDLGLITSICHRVAVVYAGEIVETGATDVLMRRPLHPYMQGLARCATNLDRVGIASGGIPGSPPVPGQWPEGCRFRTRCEHAIEGCEKAQVLRTIDDAHSVRCWRAEALQSLAAADEGVAA